MADRENLSQNQISEAVSDGIRRAGHSLLSTIIWTVLSLLALLFGAQLVQLGLGGLGVAAVGLSLVGVFVICSSLFLLYSIY